MECECTNCGKTFEVERAPVDDMIELCFECWYESIVKEDILATT